MKNIYLIAMCLCCAVTLSAQTSGKQKMISYSEFSQIKDVAAQRQTFAALSGENQYQLWAGKFELMKLLNFSKEERQHLDAFLSFITENKEGLFLLQNENSPVQFEDFVNRWQEEGKRKFKWSDELVFRIVADL